MEQSPNEKLVGAQLVKEFSAFCGTWRLVTTFTSGCLKPHETYRNIANLYSEELLASFSNPCVWRTTSCLLFATAYSIYLQ